ncbi:type II toxin-antitoxin system YafQ family toxin, partial [uncultured Dubosiella sp.]
MLSTVVLSNENRLFALCERKPPPLQAGEDVTKDYKLAIKRGLRIGLLKDIVAVLAMGEKLPEKNKDHELTGSWTGHRECHIQPDWLLIYRIEEDVLVLTLSRTGSHSDL